MTVSVPSTAAEAGGPPEAGLAARVAVGPGLWDGEEWFADRRRESLPESLLADGTITAAASAEHDHKLERALNAVIGGYLDGEKRPDRRARAGAVGLRPRSVPYTRL